MEWLLLSDLTTGRQSVRHFLRPKSSEPGLTLALVWILVWEETNQMAILQKMSLWLRYVNHAGSLCFYSFRQEVCIHGLAVKVLLLVSIYIYVSAKKNLFGHFTVNFDSIGTKVRTALGTWQGRPLCKWHNRTEGNDRMDLTGRQAMEEGGAAEEDEQDGRHAANLFIKRDTWHPTVSMS